MNKRTANEPNSKKDGEWSLVIEPTRRWLDINFRELLRYRDLVWLLVNRDFVSVYKQTILGPVWFIVNPFFTTIIYTFVFGSLAKISTDGIPQILFYFGGTMIWGYFSACLNSAADTLTGNSGLFGKVYFPRLVVPISKVFSNLISVGIQFGALICIYLYYVISGAIVRPTQWVFLLPLVFAQLAAMGLGFGMIVSSLTIKYRDLRNLVGFGVSLWMYATPIVYPLSQVPQKYKWIMIVNPVTAPIEGFRLAMYGVGGVRPLTYALSAGITIVLLFLGLILLNHRERNFIDVV